MGILSSLILSAALLATSPPVAEPKAAAESKAVEEAVAVEIERNLTVRLKTGISFFTKSQSTAIPHLLKPNIRLELARTLTPKTEIGVDVGSVVTTNPNYRVLTGYLYAAGYFHTGSLYRIGVRGGVGAGPGPRILYADLRSQQDLTGYTQFGVIMDWQLPVDRLQIGLQILVENLSVVTLALTTGWKI
ncbi:MAG: hypothetical protein CMH54_00795 [Myxococcales bacterium]|nr:hypothetical protein [Myxococcales bacterium]